MFKRVFGEDFKANTLLQVGSSCGLPERFVQGDCQRSWGGAVWRNREAGGVPWSLLALGWRNDASQDLAEITDLDVHM